jgi:hypothetical protein
MTIKDYAMTISTSDLVLPMVKRLVKKTLNKIKKQTRAQTTEILCEQEVQAQQQIQLVPTKKNSKIIGSNWLIQFQGNQSSEHGEDGIITKIFEILKPENKWVCEFGAHDPEIISNTWRLITQEYWNAVLIEADDRCFEKLESYYKNSSAVHCIKAMISYEGTKKLDTVLKETPAPADMDFMIIDIDGNDYHVWEAIETYQSKVLMIEFNASIPVDVCFVQARNLSVNQGSSLAAMAALAARKGYKLIAVTSWNAFFVKEKYFHLFFDREPELADMYVYPAKHPIWMRAFQMYDGTIAIAPWNEMLWHKVSLKPADYQVLPESYRSFSRQLAVRDYVREKDGSENSTEAENSHYLKNIYQKPANILSQFAENSYSRYGEDGMINKLIETISVQSLYFVDVGAGDGVTYSRSRNCASHHNWHGLLIEDDQELLKDLKNNCICLPKIKIDERACLLKGKDTLDEIFKSHKIPREFDLLFLNSYGMEYYLWESLQEFSPNIVAVQFNPTVPNDVKFIQAKDFSLHHGCSLKALLDLAHYKDYELAGVTMETALFVKSKFAYRCLENFGLKYADIDDMFAPVSMHLFQLYDGTISLQGLNRLLWKGLRIDEEKLQVVPSALRTFHQFADKEDKKFFYRVT